MDTIIDTRQFPKEMMQQPQISPQGEEGMCLGKILFWVVLFALVIGGIYFFWMRMQSQSTEAIPSIEEQNRTVESMHKQIDPVSPKTHERAVQSFFGE